jgi:hypothetical protein
MITALAGLAMIGGALAATGKPRLGRGNVTKETAEEFIEDIGKVYSSMGKLAYSIEKVIDQSDDPMLEPGYPWSTDYYEKMAEIAEWQRLQAERFDVKIR